MWSNFIKKIVYQLKFSKKNKLQTLYSIKSEDIKDFDHILNKIFQDELDIEINKILKIQTNSKRY